MVIGVILLIDLDNAAAAIDMRREILAWRDRHLIAATVELTQTVQDLRPAIDARLAKMSWRETMLDPSGYATRAIDPLLNEVIDAASETIVAHAQRELATIVAHRFEVETTLSAARHDDATFDAVADMTNGLLPIAGGLAIATTIPGLALSTTAGFLGLGAVTLISWPVVVGGVAVAGTAIALGVGRSGGLKARQSGKLRDRIDTQLQEAVFAADATPPSLLTRLQIAIDAAAREALSRMTHADA